MPKPESAPPPEPLAPAPDSATPAPRDPAPAGPRSGPAPRAGTGGEPPPGTVRTRRRRTPHRQVLTGGPLAVAGGALAVFGAASGLLIVPARTVLVLVGIALCAAGLARLGKAAFGAGFDLMYWFSLGWLVLVLAAAVCVPLLPLGEHTDVASTLDDPVFALPGQSGHLLGTNGFGLDLLSRSVYGARTSLTVALCAVAIGTVVGGALGVVTGYFRGAADRTVGIATNALLAVPPLVLLVALATVLDPGLRNVALSLSLLTIPSMVRVARASTLAHTQREFVLAARALGATRWRVMTRELLPNVLLPLLSMALVMVSVMIVAEASLSFLGLGVQPPEPTWGNMIAEGEGDVFQEHPHIVLVPGTVLFLTVFALNLVGERARNRWDPRSVNL